MKFSCEKAKLVEALSNVQKAVAQKSTIAALEGVLITAQKTSLTLCGYNTELGITTNLPATVSSDGSIVLDAHLFTEIIRKMPDDTVSFETTDSLMVRVFAGASHFELVGLDAKEFPSLPVVEDAEAVELPVTVLKSMIRQTLFSVAEDDTKPVHTGSLFEIKDKTLTIVSVDGYRMALRKEAIKENIELRFVVPGKTLREVLRLLPDTDETLKICAGMRHIIFYVGDYTVISRLLEGDFLDYKETVPKQVQAKISVSTKTFADSIDRVSLLITDRLKSPVRCLFSEDKIHLSCTTTLGSASDEIECKSDSQNEQEIAFNNKYMSDALKNTDTDEIEIHLNGPLSPIKILPKKGTSFLLLVLPVRIKAQ